MSKSVLVIGANGSIGKAVSSAFLQHGWRVIPFTRRMGDAMVAADVLAAAQGVDGGVDVVFHAVNPPQYKNWAGTCLPMLRNSIAAAEAVGARLAFPGTVYNFGPDVGEWVDEDAPQNPETRKGAIRVAMETEIEAFTKRGGRALILRAGDFFGGANSWLKGLVTPGKKVTSLAYPGSPEIGHAWAYLPDLAETFVQLLEREHRLDAFARFHFEGHWLTGHDLAAALSVPLKRFPWWITKLASPFVTMFREVQEMRYLWDRPLHLDNWRLVAILGSEPRTPLDAALRQSLEDIGCLSA